MVSKFSLLSSLLLVSATLAVPSSLTEAPIARAHEVHQPRHINSVASRGDVQATSDVPRFQRYAEWAGAVIRSCERTFTFVTGTITVPEGGNHKLPIVWLGVDHASCPDSALSLGFKFERSNGVPGFVAYYSWGRQYETFGDRFPVLAGDEIVAIINIVSPTVVELHLYNTRVPDHPFHLTLSGGPLCQRDVEWGIGGSDLRNFVKFYSATIVDVYTKDVNRDHRLYVDRTNIEVD